MEKNNNINPDSMIPMYKQIVNLLNEKIENAKKDIAELNKGLAQRDFNGETYEFCVSPTSRDDFKEYYKIIQSGKEYMVNNLLSETLSESQRRIMDDLFIKLSSAENRCFKNDGRRMKSLTPFLYKRN